MVVNAEPPKADFIIVESKYVVIIAANVTDLIR
jgi:hypothetical protein